jgi:hypothetical protein
MAGYKMNRYRRGPSTIVASRLRSAHGAAQLKVENPVSLRTIWNFDFRERLIAAGQGFFTPETLIKNKTASPVPVVTRTLHAKRAPSPKGGVIDENGGGSRVRLGKRHQKKKYRIGPDIAERTQIFSIDFSSRMILSAPDAADPHRIQN